MSLATCIAAVTCAVAGLWSPTASAGEGGGSHYMPGTSGDFAMALIGPAGWYFRNDLIYFQGDIDGVTLGNRVYTSASQDVWVDTMKAIHLSEGGMLGGRFGAVISVPIVLDAHAEGDLAFPTQGHKEGSRWGLGDIALTGFLNWKEGNHNWSTGLTVYTPTGAYSSNDIINMGRNYWSFDPTVTYTWLQPKKGGYEFSMTTGVMFNTENSATEYQSGTEWHADVTLAKHFSPKFALGVVGSFLEGVSDDDGRLLDRANVVLPALGMKGLGGFRASYTGVGPAVFYAAPVGGKNVNFIAKYIFEMEHDNRFSSEYFLASVAFPL